MEFFTIPKNVVERILSFLVDAHGGLVCLHNTTDGDTDVKRFICKDGLSVWLFNTNGEISINVFG